MKGEVSLMSEYLNSYNINVNNMYINNDPITNTNYINVFNLKEIMYKMMLIICKISDLIKEEKFSNFEIENQILKLIINKLLKIEKNDSSETNEYLLKLLNRLLKTLVYFSNYKELIRNNPFNNIIYGYYLFCIKKYEDKYSKAVKENEELKALRNTVEERMYIII